MSIVFSGYIKCKHCNKSKISITAASCCMRKDFEYGVLLDSEFLSYMDLYKRLKSGATFRDANNFYLPITVGTFQKA